VLVVYGKDPNTQWDFIKYDDIISSPGFNPRAPRASEKFVFKGENALMKSIVYLREGKARSVIYFTQGSGELDMNEQGGRGAERAGGGMGQLVERLKKGNYEVKELKFGLGTTTVPSDAAVIVVVRPGGNGTPMPANATKALREYMDGVGGKKGKMLVLLDLVAQRNGALVSSGLESLLGEYGVKVDNERVLALRGPTNNPADIICSTNPLSSNPVARALMMGSNRLMPLFFR